MCIDVSLIPYLPGYPKAEPITKLLITQFYCIIEMLISLFARTMKPSACIMQCIYRSADKSLARPGEKRATATKL